MSDTAGFRRSDPAGGGAQCQRHLARPPFSEETDRLIDAPGDAEMQLNEKDLARMPQDFSAQLQMAVPALR